MIREPTEVLAKVLAKKDNNEVSFDISPEIQEKYQKEASDIINNLMAEGIVLADAKSIETFIQKMNFMMDTIEERLGIKLSDKNGLLN